MQSQASRGNGGQNFRGLSLLYDTPNQHTAVLASKQWETGESNREFYFSWGIPHSKLGIRIPLTADSYLGTHPDAIFLFPEKMEKRGFQATARPLMPRLTSRLS